MRLILASGSAARAQMLEDAGVSFEVIRPDVDEDAIKDKIGRSAANAQAIAARLAQSKALAIAEAGPDDLVLGSDQVLLHGSDLLDKPGSMDEARTQLLSLRGGRHYLLSAVSLVRADTEIWSASDKVALHMRDFTDEFLDRYLQAFGKLALTSVGGYHIEGLGAQLFEKIDGDQFTVRGMPLLLVLGALRRFGMLKT
ncbi:MAG: Maf family protein [Pseudomonadota bacterium]